MTTADVGEVVNGYALDAVLGRGGMGCVYKARHVRLGRTVALKVLSSELASSEEYVSRFLAEAKIVNDVRHPNIVDISDFIELEAPRRVAYVMEFIDGPSLGRVLRERRLSLRQAINASLQICAALESVHRLSVVHRDLKPDNILVLRSLDSDLAEVPSIKILDFGIAKSSNPDSAHKTVTGSVMGTPSYMAPEQVAAQPVSAGTDVYAVGEILFEMLTGRRLFAGAPLQILKTKLIGDLPDLTLPSDVPGRERIQALIARCLAHTAGDRPSVRAVADELARISASTREPSPPGPLPPIERPLPAEDTARNMSSVALAPAAHRPRGIVAGAVLALALAAAGAYLALSPGAEVAPIVGRDVPVEPPSTPPPPAAETVAPPPVDRVAVETPPPAPKVSPRRTRSAEKVARPIVRDRPRVEEPKADAPKSKSLVKKKELMPW
jgi:serine/threonine-protein kinase